MGTRGFSELPGAFDRTENEVVLFQRSTESRISLGQDYVASSTVVGINVECLTLTTAQQISQAPRLACLRTRNQILRGNVFNSKDYTLNETMPVVWLNTGYST